MKHSVEWFVLGWGWWSVFTCVHGRRSHMLRDTP